MASWNWRGNGHMTRFRRFFHCRVVRIPLPHLPVSSSTPHNRHAEQTTVNCEKPFAPSAERNRHAILDVLQTVLSPDERVLEIGSGTGQHACHFAAHMPTISWQPTERAQNLDGIRQWVADCGCSNILPPIELDLNKEPVIISGVTSCYSANTLHIISWPLVEVLFSTAASLLGGGGKLLVYGPFLFEGQHVSDGNRQFDEHLRNSDPKSGIRDVRDLDVLAQTHGFSVADVSAMPANNHLLTWRR